MQRSGIGEIKAAKRLTNTLDICGALGSSIVHNEDTFASRGFSKLVVIW